MSEKDKPAGAGFFGTKELLKKYKKDTPGESVKEVYKNSGLGKWFGQSAGGEAGWDRYNTKGERVGKCGDSKPGEGKPKCLSPKKARQLRSQGGKKAIGNAAKRKKAQDPDTDRPGTGNKPINVSNNIKKEDRDMKSAKEFLNDMINEQINEDLLNEKNKPTNPALWTKSISAAKSKFEVYPSAYANAWASKHYKAAGGSWESTNEEVDLDEALKVSKKDGPFTVVAIKGGKVVDTFRGAEHGELKDVVAFSKANNKGAKISVEAKGGKIVHTEGFEIDDELIDLDLSEAKKKRITKLHGKYPKGTHFCATHVEHADFGHGNPIHSQHAAPDEFGDIDWYDVMFEHGIEQGVATDDLQIHLGEAHYDHVEHDHPGEDLEEAEFDSRKSAEEIRLRTKYRMSKDGGKDGKPYSPEDMHGAMDSLHRKKARTSGVRRLGSQHPSNKKLNLKIGEAMGPGIAHKDGLKDAQKTPSMQRYYAQVRKDQAARAKQIEQERKDGIRSKYESVEQVDEVSSDTLRSYVTKRRKQTVKDLSREDGGHNDSKLKKNNRGVVNALSRLDARKNKLEPELKREEVEQVDEMSAKAHYKTYQKKFIVPPIDRARNPNREKEGLEGPYRSKKSGKVFYYDTKAGKYYDADSDIYLKVSDVMEAVEQVDELNRDTLGSYADKARGDIEGIKNVLKAKKLGPVSDKHRADLERELANRTKGRKKAIGKKYTREDAEQVDELTVKTLRSYISKAQKDNTQRVTRMADKPSHMKADKGEMDKLRKRQRGVVKAKTDIDMRKILGKNYRGRMGEDVELTESFEFQFADKETAQEFMREISQKRLGSSTGTSDGKVRTEGPVGAGVGSPTRAHQQMAKIMKKHGGKILRTDEGPRMKKVFKEDVEQVDEVSSKTLRSYVHKRRGEVQSDLYTGKHSPKTNKSAKGVVAALSRLDARKNKLEPELKREEVEQVIEAKVGDTVHLGHATKGGSGVKGKVVKIDGRNVHIKNDKGAMFKGPMDRVTVGEAIKYDAAHPDQGITGKVTGKGKRDRGPKGSRTSGEVRTKYSGHPAYKDDSPGLPIKANDIGRLIKTARKPKTKPYDSRNVRNPRLTKDHVEHGVAEGMADSAKRAAKILAARTPKNVHNPGHPEKSSAGDREARRRERDKKFMLNNREGVEDMTAAQERDRKHRDNPTRNTVANVRLPSTDAERALMSRSISQTRLESLVIPSHERCEIFR